MPATWIATRDLPLAGLGRFPGNARRGNVEEIRKSIKRHGQYRAIVVRQHDGQHTILAGNHTADASHDWKAAHGISDTAIRAKSRALRGVLIPQPQNSLITMIKTAGWKSPEVLFRWHQWAVIGAFAA